MLSATALRIQRIVSGGRTSLWMRRAISHPAIFGSLIPAVTLLNAIVGMLLPQMMLPKAFGEYSLVATLFNYGLIFDFGVSQMIDRAIPAQLAAGDLIGAQRTAATLLWLRLRIGLVSLLVAGAGLLLLAQLGALPFSAAAGLFAVLAGLADMIALGPACLQRAGSHRRNYALMISALLLGLVIARPGGLIVGGIVGSFAATAAWYVSCALLFHARVRLPREARPRASQAAQLIVAGLPFFATSLIWAFYVTGNRWFASLLLDGHAFGQFAFAANICSLLVGAIGGFSAFYYPRMAGQIANSAPFAQSARLTRDFARLIGAVAVLMAVGIMLSGILIRLIYPNYLPSLGIARIILVAVPPMVLASWLMPVSQSAGSRPWIDGFIIFPLATLLLGLASAVLERSFGVEGIAWASTASAIPLVAIQLAALHHGRILHLRHAATLLALTITGCGALSLLTWSVAS